MILKKYWRKVSLHEQKETAEKKRSKNKICVDEQNMCMRILKSVQHSYSNKKQITTRRIQQLLSLQYFFVCLFFLQGLLLQALRGHTLWLGHVQHLHKVTRRDIAHAMRCKDEKLTLALVRAFQRIALHHLQGQGARRFVHVHIVFIQQAERTLNLMKNATN